MLLPITAPQLLEIIGTLLTRPEDSCKISVYDPDYSVFIEDLAYAVSRFTLMGMHGSCLDIPPTVESIELNFSADPVFNFEWVDYPEQPAKIWSDYIHLSSANPTNAQLQKNAMLSIKNRASLIINLLQLSLTGKPAITLPIPAQVSDDNVDIVRQYEMTLDITDKSRRLITIAPSIVAQSLAATELTTAWVVEIDCLNSTPRIQIHRGSTIGSLSIELGAEEISVFRNEQDSANNAVEVTRYPAKPDELSLTNERRLVFMHYVQNICTMESAYTKGVPIVSIDQFKQEIEANGARKKVIVDFYPYSSCPKQMFTI